MYKFNLRVAKLSLLLISAYLSYFLGGYYEQSLYDCSVQLEGVSGLSLTSEKKFNVQIDIEMLYRKIYLTIDEDGTIAWKGVVNFIPNRDFSGRVSSLTISSIEDGFIIEGMETNPMLEQKYKLSEIPFSINPVDGNVYYVKLSKTNFFCINKNIS
ncbi:hypothetical protein [Aeromonas jandaei]|uniref:hypothetical protein n=1 Tax=Aeromonas jandaei TaxID=650 RepID=UPI001ABF2C42|nr:hypothetical protein [Aeromonas jandaei]QSR75023.1 hypothetical protein GP488_21240 [Aeromonas jandaei]